MGAVVNAVEKGGPAEKAGWSRATVILRFDGKPVNSSADLPRLVAATKPGMRAVVQVWRKGRPATLPSPSAKCRMKSWRPGVAGARRRVPNRWSTGSVWRSANRRPNSVVS